MKNMLLPTRPFVVTTLLSLVLLFLLPLLYSFHFVTQTSASTNYQRPLQQDAVAASITPFTFNPNTISETDLNRLGLPQRMIKTILVFRGKGGTFRKVEDLSKLYGMTDAAFEKLKPYVQLP